MREIEFRGKPYPDKRKNPPYDDHIAEDGWLYGGITYDSVPEKKVWVNYRRAFPDTVGQYTGLKDRNGVKIFEGDIVKMRRGPFMGRTLTGAVVWEDGGIWIHYKNPISNTAGILGIITAKDYRGLVIGNIHDNPELLEAVQ